MPLSEHPSGRELADFAGEVRALLTSHEPGTLAFPFITALQDASEAIDYLADRRFAVEARAQIEAEARENEWLATPRSQGVTPPPSLTLNGEVWDLVAGGHWRRRIDSDEILDPPTWTLVVGPGRKAKFNQSSHVVTVK